MSASKYDPITAGVEEIRESWGWFMFLGIALIILGSVCVVFDITATFATVLVFGWLLLISGVVQLIHAFRIGSWSGFFLFLLGALLRGVTGYLLIRYPLLGAESLTLVLGSFFIVGGLFRAIGSSMAKLPNWGWGVASGVLSVILGVMVLWQVPITGLWFVGFAVGVDMIFDGVAVCAFAAALRHLFKGPAFLAA
jgi:uncharacterized membrane protein HdeD (DUF308 family)